MVVHSVQTTIADFAMMASWGLDVDMSLDHVAFSADEVFLGEIVAEFAEFGLESVGLQLS